MKAKYTNYQDTLFFITILFFIVGMVHVSFSILGFLCFSLPFYYYIKYKDKFWCKYICPRAGLFNTIISKVNIGLKTPKIFSENWLKKVVIIYFAINLFFVTMSTTAVTFGRIQPIEQIRFLIIFRLPIILPQLFELSVPPNMIHLGYRVYSMMFTSTVIGVILGILYKPRTWCSICPINTLTTPDKKSGKKSYAKNNNNKVI